jgi:hypothetical protein
MKFMNEFVFCDLHVFLNPVVVFELQAPPGRRVLYFVISGPAGTSS